MGISPPASPWGRYNGYISIRATNMIPEYLRRSEIKKAQDRNDDFFYMASMWLFVLWLALVLSAII